MIDPILVMATPRSGSSMTAGLLALHGVWTGNVRPGTGRNPKGFFESLTVRRLIVAHAGKLVHSGALAERRPGFRAKVEAAFAREHYPGGPWLWKGSALYWPAWHEWPCPRYIVCRRDIDATVASLKKPPFAIARSDDAALYAIVRAHHAAIDTLVAEHDALEVDTQAVALGDFTTIRRAIEGSGLEFHEEICHDFVDRSLWHELA